MNCLIVVNGYQVASGVTHQLKRYKEELLKRNIAFDIAKNNEVLALIGNFNIESKLPKYDFVLYLDKDKYVARMLEKNGYRLFNSAEATELCDDKLLTEIALANNGIRMPKTISGPLCYADSGDRSFLDKVEKELSYPIIVKECFGSLGKQVYLAKNHQELASIYENVKEKPHLYQEFIETSKGVDYRIIVIGGKAIAAMKRINDTSFKSNIAQGGHSEVVKLTPDFIETAEKASQILKLDYCGVDLLLGKIDTPVLSEVNSNAFFEGIESTTGVNVAGQYIDYIVKKIEGEN